MGTVEAVGALERNGLFICGIQAVVAMKIVRPVTGRVIVVVVKERVGPATVIIMVAGTVMNTKARCETTNKRRIAFQAEIVIVVVVQEKCGRLALVPMVATMFDARPVRGRVIAGVVRELAKLEIKTLVVAGVVLKIETAT